MNSLTIVMYHYVRPLAISQYPAIKGLDLALFDQQLDYIEQHYIPVSMEALIDAMNGGEELPPNAILLTFDDGYLDHYTYVFPRLVARSIAGAFFPPSQVVLERKVLDVNKIHFILASGVPPTELEHSIEQIFLERSPKLGLSQLKKLRSQYRHPNRYDSVEVSYVKHMLQHALPETLRAEITATLFSRYVSKDEIAFAESLYVSVDQLKVMLAAGQHIGSHGDAHYWLGKLSDTDQEKDIIASLRLLSAIGTPSAYRTICYPYGSFNDTTVAILNRLGFKAAVTTEPSLASLSPTKRFSLARLDTNDLPKSATAEPCHWTMSVLPNSVKYQQ